MLMLFLLDRLVAMARRCCGFFDSTCQPTSRRGACEAHDSLHRDLHDSPAVVLGRSLLALAVEVQVVSSRVTLLLAGLPAIAEGAQRGQAHAAVVDAYDAQSMMPLMCTSSVSLSLGCAGT